MLKIHVAELCILPRYICICSTHRHSFIPILTSCLTTVMGYVASKVTVKEMNSSYYHVCRTKFMTREFTTLEVVWNYTPVLSYPVFTAYCVLSENPVGKLLTRGISTSIFGCQTTLLKIIVIIHMWRGKGSHICMQFSCTVSDLRRHTHVLLVVFSCSHFNSMLEQHCGLNGNFSALLNSWGVHWGHPTRAAVSVSPACVSSGGW